MFVPLLLSTAYRLSSAPALAAARLMVKENVHRAVVVNDQGKLVGMVTPMDIMKAIVLGLQIDDLPPESHAEAAVAVEYVDLRVLDAINDASAEPTG